MNPFGLLESLKGTLVTVSFPDTRVGTLAES